MPELLGTVLGRLFIAGADGALPGRLPVIGELPA
jgi:hypothetical protein